MRKRVAGINIWPLVSCFPAIACQSRNFFAAALRLFDHEHRYDRIWCEVLFTVPDDWHHIGILGVRHENVEDGWFFPNRPGAQHITFTWRGGASP